MYHCLTIMYRMKKRNDDEHPLMIFNLKNYKTSMKMFLVSWKYFFDKIVDRSTSVQGCMY